MHFKLILILIALFIYFLWGISIIINPTDYRSFLATHPTWDPKCKWTSASDGELRKDGLIMAILSIVVAVFLLLFFGII